MAQSWKAEVVAESYGDWIGNEQRFATEEEALNYVANLYARWSAVRRTRVVESDDAVNATWTGNAAGSLTPLPRVTEDMKVEPITDVDQFIADLRRMSDGSQ